MARDQDALQQRAGTGALPAFQALKQKVQEECRPRPGVYRFSCAGQTIYIGRSKALRARLLSYFRAERGEKAFTIVRSADALHWEYTASEFASHLAELEEIKANRPTYNRALKDEDDYVFVSLRGEPAPRLFLTREPEGFGPFRSPRRIEGAVRRLSDLLGLRTSPDHTPIIDPAGGPPPAGTAPRCMRGQLGLCAAPCAGRVALSAYREQVETARRFLAGSELGLIDGLRAKMKEAAARLEFERAALFRDRAEQLSAIYTELLSWREELDWLTLVYAVPGYDQQDTLYFLHGGRVTARLPRPQSPAAWKRARALARQISIPAAPPRTGREVDEIKVVASWFRSHPAEILRARRPAQFLQQAAWYGGTIEEPPHKP